MKKLYGTILILCVIELLILSSGLAFAYPGMAVNSTNAIAYSSSINFYGEKTDVYLGEDIITKLSIVNLVSNPKMNAQVIILPPSGMSVTSTEFTKTSAGQFAANFEIYPNGGGRNIEIILRPNQVGEFNVKGRVVYYFGEDKENTQDYTLDLPVSVRLPVATTPAPTISTPINTPIQIIKTVDSETHVYLYGEKTDVIINEDILLRLSAVNTINKPVMTVQVILYPPSGMSVTGQDFVKSGAGIYTTTYKLEPSDSKDIEIRIRPNQIGDFNVKGIIIYYFDNDKSSAETITKMLPIKVSGNKDDIKNVRHTPGFEALSAIFLLVLTVLSKNKR